MSGRDAAGGTVQLCWLFSASHALRGPTSLVVLLGETGADKPHLAQGCKACGRCCSAARSQSMSAACRGQRGRPQGSHLLL